MENQSIATIQESVNTFFETDEKLVAFSIEFTVYSTEMALLRSLQKAFEILDAGSKVK